MKLVLSGSVPSQKNNKQILINRKTDKPFVASNANVKRWQQSAVLQLQSQFNGFKVVDYPIAIDLVIYYKDNLRRDLDNAVNGIMDCLVKAKVIEDDDTKHISQICVQYGGIDKENPRAEIFIEDD